MIASALLLLLQAGAPTADVIKLRSGTEIKGKVSLIGSKSISYADAAGKPGTVKTEDVADVVLADAPPSLRRAEAAAAEGNHAKALNLFPVAMEELGAGKGRPMNKPYVLWGWALAYHGSGNSGEALKMLKRLRSECGDCRHHAMSFDKSLEIARAAGGEGLDGVLEEMKAAGGPAGAKAEMELGKRAYERGDYDAAGAVFERQAAGTGPAAEEARLWQLRALRRKKKTDDADALANRVLADRTSAPGLVQAAAAALGQNQLAKAGKDVAKIREALMTFSLAASVGPASARDDLEDYAAALLGAAKCYALLEVTLEKAELKEDYRSRAVSYCREIQRACRGTRWASEAQDQLVELGAEEKKAGGDDKKPAERKP